LSSASLPFDVVCVMRGRTPLPRNVIEWLPNLKLIASTGPVNASIDVAAGTISVPVVATYGFGQFKEANADAARSRGKVLFTSNV
jgi:phosphoglycerate dehydrogenase-like enzyme